MHLAQLGSMDLFIVFFSHYTYGSMKVELWIYVYYWILNALYTDMW